MKNLKKAICMMLALLICMGSVIVANPIKAEAAYLNKTSLSIYPGKTATLKLVGGTPKWSSTNTAIATVTTAGKVKAKKVGTCTIVAKVGTKKYTCKVTVKKYPVTTIKSAWNKYWTAYQKNSGGAYCYSYYDHYTTDYVYYVMRAYTGFTFNVRINRNTGKIYGKFASGYDLAGNAAVWEYWENIAKYL